MNSVRAMPRVSNPLAFVWHNMYHMCIFICMYTYVYIYAYMCIYIHTYVCMNSVCAVPRSHPLLGPSLLPLCQGRHLWGGIFNTRIYLHVEICVCACACACIHVYVRVRKYGFMSIYMCGVFIQACYTVWYKWMYMWYISCDFLALYGIVGVRCVFIYHICTLMWEVTRVMHYAEYTKDYGREIWLYNDFPFVKVHIYVHVHTYIRMHVYIHIYNYIYIYTYVYLHTYI